MTVEINEHAGADRRREFDGDLVAVTRQDPRARRSDVLGLWNDRHGLG